MNAEQIRMMLHKVCSDLTYIHDSQALETIAQLPQAHPNLIEIATDSLYFATLLKLRVKQALDTNLEAEVDNIFKDAA